MKIIFLVVTLCVEYAYLSKPNVILMGYLTGSEILENLTYYDREGLSISGAITYAMDQINHNSSILPNHTLDLVVAETYGQEDYSIRETILLRRKNISVYIGPQETCIHEGRIAASFNMPMISYVSFPVCFIFVKYMISVFHPEI